LGGVINSLRSLIDRIDSNFREAKDLILDLARRLDEERVVKQGHVSRKIKEILEDKISQGKISEKWIEECYLINKGIVLQDLIENACLYLLVL
jgi:hypothetical protein